LKAFGNPVAIERMRRDTPNQAAAERPICAYIRQCGCQATPKCESDGFAGFHGKM
jgi:hypothetical protein